MKIKLTPIPQMPPEDLTDREALLLNLLGEREEYLQRLIDENVRSKGEKGKPKIKPSRLEPKKKPQNHQQQEDADSVEKKGHQQKRPGSAKRRKTASLTIHSTQIIKPGQDIPTGSEFKGYKDYTVCDLKLEPHNILYRQEQWKTPTGEYLSGKLPNKVLEQGQLEPGLDELKELIKSNALAIEALTESKSELGRDRAQMYELMADLTTSQSGIFQVLENLDNRQGQIVGILRLLTNRTNH